MLQRTRREPSESLEMFLFCIVKQGGRERHLAAAFGSPARPATRTLKTPDWWSLTAGGKRGYTDSLQHVQHG